MTPTRWGLWGLLAFEALLAAYLFSFGVSSFVLMAALGAALLAFALVLQRSDPVVPAWLFLALAAVTLWRGVAQALGGMRATGYLTFLVPIGFVLAAVSSRRASPRLLAIGIALVGVARAWFVLSYAQGQALPIAAANVFGALGCAVWAYGAWSREALKPESDLASA